MRLADGLRGATTAGSAWRPFLLTFAVVAAALFFQFANNVQPVKPFVAAHWVWDYSLGFIRRGLLGAATEAVWGAAADSDAFIERASLAICAAAYLAYALFAALVVAAKPSPVAFAAAVAGALLASALPVFAYDFGRPDQINFVLFLLACVAVLRLPMAAALACVVASSAAAMLVHEAYFVLRVPTLLALALLRFHARDGLPILRVAAGVLLAFALLAAVLGALMSAGSPAVGPAAWRGHWEAQAPFLVGHSPDDAGDALAVHGRGTAENVRLTWQEFRKRTAAVTAFTLACVALVAAAAWFRAPRTDWARRHRWLHLLAFLALFSPAAMFPVGFDYMRWDHNILTNALLGVLCLAGLGAFSAAGPRAPGQAAGGGWGRFAATLAASVAFVALLFPQTSGVVEGRDFPKPFVCLAHRTLGGSLGAAPPRCETMPAVRNPVDD